MAWSAGGVHDDSMLIKLELAHPRKMHIPENGFLFLQYEKLSLIHIHWVDPFGLYINIHKINYIAKAED